MNRISIINAYITKRNYLSYLELGCQNDLCFNAINAPYKIGVDPAFGGTIRLTSDEFFAQNKDTFDICFIDGMHHADYVYRDIINSLACLNEGGVIICHDMLPTKEVHQVTPRISKIWNGNCWKAWVKLRSEFTTLSMKVVDCDYGVGIIQNGEQNLITIPAELTYEYFDKNRKELMNVITVEEFKESLK